MFNKRVFAKEIAAFSGILLIKKIVALMSIILYFSQIDKIKVWTTDYVLTLAIPGAVLIGGIIYWATWDLNLDLDWDQTN